MSRGRTTTLTVPALASGVHPWMRPPAGTGRHQKVVKKKMRMDVGGKLPIETGAATAIGWNWDSEFRFGGPSAFPRGRARGLTGSFLPSAVGFGYNTFLSQHAHLDQYLSPVDTARKSARGSV